MSGFKVDLAMDKGLRDDILAAVKGCLREHAERVITATVREEGWLAKRVDAYFEKNPLQAQVREVLRDSRSWQTPAFKVLLNQIVDEKLAGVQGSLEAHLQKAIAQFVKTLDDRVKTLVSEDLKRRLG